MSGQTTEKELPFEWFTVGGIIYDSIEEACDADHGWYLNEYEVSREYGGPEEGGWWYNLRIPTGTSYPMPYATTFEEACEAAHPLDADAWLANKRDNPRGIYSVIGGRDLEWNVEQHPPRQQPMTRPHYE